MPKSKLSKHFNGLLAQNQEEEALNLLRAMVQGLPDLQVRSSINLLLMGEPIPWERVLERLEQAIGKLDQEQVGDFNAIIGNNNIDLSYIFGSNITIQMGSSTAPKTYRYTLDHHRAEGPVIGREETLQALEALVQSTDNLPIVIWGAKGAGKTLLAELFWEKHKNSYDAVGWLNFRAGLVNTLILEISSVDSSHINLEQYPEKQLETHARFKIVSELQNRAGKKLLILDNVPVDSDVPKYLDWFRIADLQLIITAHEPMDHTRAFALPRLREEDIVDLFKVLSGQDADEDTRVLLKQLDQNPLLTRLIARNVPHEDLRKATEWIQALGKALLEPSEGLIPEQSLLWALLERSVQGPEQQWLLLQLAAMPAVGFELETLAGLILPEGSDLEDAAGLQVYLEDIQVAASGLDIEAALEQLSDSAWLEFKEEEWWLPDAVREVIQKCYHSHSSYFKDLIESIRLSYFDEEYGHIKGNALFISHLKGILPFLEYGETYLILHRLLIKTYNDLVNWYEEEKELRLLLKVIKENDGQWNSDFWIICITLSECLRRTGKLKDAYALSKKLVKLHNTIHSNESELYLAHREQGLTQFLLGNFPTAAELIEKVLSKARTQKRPDLYLKNTTTFHLAVAYRYIGNYNRMSELLDDFIDTMIHNFPFSVTDYFAARFEVQLKPSLFKMHASEMAFSTIVDSQNNYPCICQISDLDIAYELYMFLAKDNSKIRNLNFLVFLGGQKNLKKDLEGLESLSNSIMLSIGKEHPFYLNNQSNIALVYLIDGNPYKALEYTENSLMKMTIYFGNAHPCIAILKSNLAIIYNMLDRKVEAIELLNEALKIAELNFCIIHPIVISCRSNLGMILNDLGHYDEALKLLKTVVACSKIIYGSENPSLSLNQFSLAGVYLNKGQLLDAKQVVEEAATTLKANFGIEHPYHKKAVKWLDLVSEKRDET